MKYVSVYITSTRKWNYIPFNQDQFLLGYNALIPTCNGLLSCPNVYYTDTYISIYSALVHNIYSHVNYHHFLLVLFKSCISERYIFSFNSNTLSFNIYGDI